MTQHAPDQCNDERVAPTPLADVLMRAHEAADEPFADQCAAIRRALDEFAVEPDPECAARGWCARRGLQGSFLFDSVLKFVDTLVEELPQTHC